MIELARLSEQQKDQKAIKSKNKISIESHIENHLSLFNQ